MNEQDNAGENLPGTPVCPQPPLPFPSPQGNYTGLTIQQLHENFRQAWINTCAWPRLTPGYPQGNAPDGNSYAWHYWLTSQQTSGLNVARKHAGDTLSQHDLILQLGLDPNGDLNHRHT